MKKIFFLLIFLGVFLTDGYAQNANRSGFFMEAGTGFLIGNPPLQKLEWKDYTMKAYVPSGPDVNIALGYRRATSNVFAWEIKFEASGDPKAMVTTSVLAVMPGIRYTTKEIFGNSSLFFGANLGVAMGTDQSIYDLYSFHVNETFEPDNRIFTSIGGKLSLTVGLNITSKFYLGVYFDYNFISNQIVNTDITFNNDGYNIIELYNYGGWNSFGSLGLRIGYRF